MHVTTLVLGTVLTFAYVTRSGELVAFVMGDGSGNQTAITAINANPAVTVNGQAVQLLGPFWDRANHSDPFLFYKLPSVLKPTDVVTVSAPAGWVTTAAGPAPATSGRIGNYTAKFEPPLFGMLPFDYLPRGPTSLQVGFNRGMWSNLSPFAPGFVGRNWFKRGGWQGGIGSFTSDGRPATITSGNGNTSIAITSGQANNVDGSHYPSLSGVWSFVADETNPAAAMRVSLSVSTAGKITSGPTTFSDPTKPGTLVNGVLVGQTWQWRVEYVANPTEVDLGIFVNFQTRAGQPGNYTLTNEAMFPPDGPGGKAQSLDRSKPEATDPNFLRMARGSAVLRDNVGALDGAQSNIVTVADMHALSDVSWRISKRSSTASITQIRRYSLTVSPSVYWATKYLGSAPNAGGSGNLAYSWNPTSIAYADAGQFGAGYFVGEAVTDAPHGLCSGQLVTWGGTMPTIAVTNGNGAPLNYTFGDGGSGGPTLKFPIFVTGANTFAFWAYCGATTKDSLQANTVAAAYSVPSGSPFTATVKAQDGGSLVPIEVIAESTAKVPGCAGWAAVPALASDELVAWIANVWLSYLPPDRICYVEVSNEPWNYLFWQNPPLNAALGNMAGAPWNTLGYLGGYTLRALQVAQVFRNVWATQGRGWAIRSLINVQSVAPHITAREIGLVNTYNAANPGSPMALNAVAVAPYTDAVTDGTRPTDQTPSYIWAASSIIAAADNTTIASPAVNPGNPFAANPWTLASWCDYLRHLNKYNHMFAGANGNLAAQKRAIASYNPVAGQSPLELIVYEGALSTLAPVYLQPTVRPMNNPYTTGRLTHDVFYHPEMYYVELSYLQMMESGGVSRCALEALQNVFLARRPDTTQVSYWCYGAWAGQQAGRGDGSDGRGINLFWKDTGKAQHLGNVSPRLQAAQDWIKASR
jgi:hypothetical protein